MIARASRSRRRRRRSTPARGGSKASQLALRMRDGVERSAFSEETLELLDGMVVAHPTDPDRVVLTRSGRLMANEISLRFALTRGADEVDAVTSANSSGKTFDDLAVEVVAVGARPMPCTSLPSHRSLAAGSGASSERQGRHGGVPRRVEEVGERQAARAPTCCGRGAASSGTARR